MSTYRLLQPYSVNSRSTDQQSRTALMILSPSFLQLLTGSTQVHSLSLIQCLRRGLRKFEWKVQMFLLLAFIYFRRCSCGQLPFSRYETVLLWASLMNYFHQMTSRSLSSFAQNYARITRRFCRTFALAASWTLSRPSAQDPQFSN
jgi:hypothetical protein